MGKIFEDEFYRTVSQKAPLSWHRVADFVIDGLTYWCLLGEKPTRVELYNRREGMDLFGRFVFEKVIRSRVVADNGIDILLNSFGYDWGFDISYVLEEPGVICEIDFKGNIERIVKRRKEDFSQVEKESIQEAV